MNTTKSSNSKSSKTQTSACLLDCDLTYLSKLVRQLTRIIDNNGRNPRLESDFMVEDKNKSGNSQSQKITSRKNELKQLKSRLNTTKKKKTKQYSKPQPKKPKVGKAEAKKKAEVKKKYESNKKYEEDKRKEEEAKRKEEEAKKTYEEELEEQLTEEEITGFQIDKTNMDRLANRVCEIIISYGTDGMLQTELWKKLKLSSRDGSRLALKLERLGMITREKILEKGRWTYKQIIRKAPVTTKSIENPPCLVSPEESKCSLNNEISPKTCQYIEDWVFVEIKTSKSK